MASDEEKTVRVPLGYDLKIRPTDEKLKADALSLVSQYLHFWMPGEVECTVILSRSDSKRPTYGTSIMERERLVHSLECVKAESAIQSLLVSNHKPRR